MADQRCQNLLQSEKTRLALQRLSYAVSIMIAVHYRHKGSRRPDQTDPNLMKKKGEGNLGHSFSGGIA
jgi:hypothetical protein